MLLNETTIRGVLDLSWGAPKIRARVHGIIKPLSVESTNVTFSNDITVTNVIHSTKKSDTWINANKGNAIISSDVTTGFTMLDRLVSTNGYFIDGVYNAERIFAYTAKSKVTANDNSSTYYLTLLNEDGDTKLANNLSVPGNATITNTVSAKNITASNAISAKDINATNNLTAGNNATITNTVSAKDITASNNITAAGTVKGKNGNITGALTVGSSTSAGSATIYGNLTVSNTVKTNKLVMTASYGTGNPPSSGVEGQVYFKII